jgi:hypothetical protein
MRGKQAMKKIMVLATIFLTTILLSGCQIFGMVEIADTMDNMNNLESYKMTMETYYEDELIDTSYVYVDGNHQHITGIMDMYLVEQDGVLYTLEPFFGVFKLQEMVDNSDSYDEFDEYATFEFTKKDGYYIVSSENIDIEGVEELKFKIEDDLISEMILSMEVLDEQFEMVIIYSHYNEIEVDMPYYVSLETVQEINQLSVNAIAEIRFTNSDYTTFQVFADFIQIECDYNYKICYFDSQGMIMYHMEYETIVDPEQGENNYIPYEDFVASNKYEDLNNELFEYINGVYEVLTQVQEYK